MDATKREALASSHISLVAAIAWSEMRASGTCGPIDDLRSAGLTGLAEAVNRFDDSRGVKFPAYAKLRIRGAIRDYRRDASLLTRSEMAAKSTAQRRLVPETEARKVAATGPRPDSLVETRERRERVAAMLETLGERDRYVIRRYFFDERTLLQIGRELGVVESRVSQLCRRALKRLRERAVS
jgi:RNA polymerase sigma factor FliA